MTLENKTQTEKLSEDLTQARSEVKYLVNYML
jgi:hypothetical protein